MRPFARFRLRLTALLVMLPRTALAQNPYSGGADLVVGLFLACIALVSSRQLVRSVSGVVMARLAITASGGSARSGALQAAAGRVPHARPAAASIVSRGNGAGTDARKAANLAAARRS
jgi:hypothetical protein